MNYFRSAWRRALVLTGALLFAMVFVPKMTGAQTNDAFPSKPITLIVPSEPGGAVDLIARPLAQHLSKKFGKPVIVDNKPGASGAIGATFVSRATPDGYTLFVGPGTVMVVNPMVNKTQYDVARDFRPIGLLANAELVFVANPSYGFKTLSDVIQYAKKNPGKLAYGSFGYGSSFHLATEYLLDETGIDLLHVPFKGGPATETAMISGQVDVMIANTAYVLSNIRAGRMTALAIVSPGRSREFPDVPSASTTVPNYEVNTWVGLYAPAGTDGKIISKINEATNDFLRDPKNIESLRSKGLEPLPGSVNDALRFQSEEQTKWAKIVALTKKKGRLKE